MRQALVQISLLFPFLLLSGCQSDGLKQYEKLRIGMDKSDVLEIMGSPQTISRHQSKDEWIYKFYRDQQWFEREVQFSDGKATYLGDVLKPGEEPQKHAPEFTPLE